ncbi:DcaP family trimeric outer membrane transporter [Shewanella litorisediminis]|uniref:Porin n=1 Tax=Shewanella litorisediminis TaxID=1173586 RepID=A0ABX7FZC3_9GAMM|nr:DcaP family trimeric outer membrane transporter [Shewanella litorisediminis]MCL2918659.1 DcaP family trimeric outer membrane transporter [Shewanella litorisediminis]QRH00366.1 porin [Shewanella litorisediminis]
MKQAPVSLALASALLAMSGAAVAETGKTDFKFGGYIKADVMFSDYSNGAPESGDLSRQFYVPGTIYGKAGNGEQVVDFQARETRFNFKTTTDLDGHTLTGFIELDFMTHTDGNERVSNSYSPRIRHAFVSYDNWTVGQTWTTFQNPGALPENLDFVGAADGTPFVRQAQLRYTNGGFQFAVENPETTISGKQDPKTGIISGGSDRITSGSGMMPDLVARYNFKTEGGASFSVAAIGRQLNLEKSNVDDSVFGYGASFAGVIPLGKDDLKFTATWGEGLGRYMGLNFANAASVDGDGQLDTIGSYGGFVSYRHWWNEQWRSSFTLSGMKVDNNVDITGENVSKDAYSAYVNLLYSPSKPLTFGVEYMFATNSKENGVDGDLNRVIFSAKYVL